MVTLGELEARLAKIAAERATFERAANLRVAQMMGAQDVLRELIEEERARTRYEERGGRDEGEGDATADPWADAAQEPEPDPEKEFPVRRRGLYGLPSAAEQMETLAGRARRAGESARDQADLILSGAEPGP